jgi:hypothetical protein
VAVVELVVLEAIGASAPAEALVEVVVGDVPDPRRPR